MSTRGFALVGPRGAFALLLIAGSGASAVGCNRGGAARAVAPTPTLDVGAARCSVVRSEAAPFVVEWDASDRAQLESAARRGMVAVRHGGCELEILAGCLVEQTYRYSALTPKHESLEVADADELYARFPRGAVRLEAELERAGRLAVDMMIVGRYESDTVEVGRADLTGPCDDATHVVTGLTVGAFRFHTGSKGQLGARVDVTGVGGAGASTEHSTDALSVDGEAEACDRSGRDDEAPPDGCGAPIRLELVPLLELQRDERQDMARRGLFDRATPWRKNAVRGVALIGTGAGSTPIMVGGIVASGNAMGEDANGDSVVTNPGLRAAGITLIVVGAIGFYGGYTAGTVLLGAAAIKRRNTRKEAGLVGPIRVGPGGLSVSF